MMQAQAVVLAGMACSSPSPSPSSSRPPTMHPGRRPLGPWGPCTAQTTRPAAAQAATLAAAGSMIRSRVAAVMPGEAAVAAAIAMPVRRHPEAVRVQGMAGQAAVVARSLRGAWWAASGPHPRWRLARASLTGLSGVPGRVAGAASRAVTGPRTTTGSSLTATGSSRTVMAHPKTHTASSSHRACSPCSPCSSSPSSSRRRDLARLLTGQQQQRQERKVQQLMRQLRAGPGRRRQRWQRLRQVVRRGRGRHRARHGASRPRHPHAGGAPAAGRL
mmetsp:Transcript_30221/g.77038  ORF Transcript_30221/g.77038 Transcript_30221/m.77038 type:complete len:274 (-) Transcript_30221:55-876(-)